MAEAMLITAGASTVPLFLKFAVSILAEKLQDGFLTDQTFLSLILQELDKANSKLNGIARKELFASISLLQKGINRLSTVLGSESLLESSVKTSIETMSTSQSTVSVEDAVTLANTLGKLKIESSEFNKAIECFKDAARSATQAFHNTALNTQERILASKVRFTSAFLENLDDPEIVASDCLQYLKEMHDMPAIKNIFFDHVQGRVKSLFKRDSRKEIVESVTMLNLILADFISKFTKRRIPVLDWPKIECGNIIVNPVHCKDERLPNRKEITPPSMDIVEPKDDEFLVKRGIDSNNLMFTLNKKGDLICFTKAKGGPQKLVKTTHELQPYCHSESRTDVVSIAVDDDDTLYVLTDEDGSYSLSVYSADGMNKDESTLKFIKRRSTVQKFRFVESFQICITNNKSIVIADEYPWRGDTVYICNRNGELINSFNPREDPALDCSVIHSVSVSSDDEIAIVTRRGNTFRLSTYTQAGKFQRTVTLRASGNSDHVYSDIYYNHVTNTIIGYVINDADKSFIEFVSGETGELQRSYLLYSTNFPDTSFHNSRLVYHANGRMALVLKSRVVYLQNPPPST